MLGPSSEYNLSLVRKLKRAFAMPFIRTIHSGMMALLGGDVLVQDDPGSNLRGFSSHLADYLVLHRRLSRSRRTQHIIRLIDRASLLIRSHSKGFAGHLGYIVRGCRFTAPPVCPKAISSHCLAWFRVKAAGTRQGCHRIRSVSLEKSIGV
jgi:hypothetical protein